MSKSDDSYTTQKSSSDGSLLAVLALTSFLTPFMGNAVNLTLPEIGREFGMDVVALSWITTSFVLSAAVFLIPFGRLADIYGRRRLFLTGISIFTLASICCFFAAGGAMLIAARTLQGLGSAMIFGTSMAIASSLFPPPRTGRAFGIIIGAVYMGAFLGPVIGGLMTSLWGWRSVFALTAIMGFCAALTSIHKIKDEWAYSKGEAFDLAGSVLYGVATCLALYGTSILPCLSGWLCLASGIITGAVFCFRERRVSHPVFDIGIFLRNKAFSMSCLAAMINYSATFAVGFLLSLHLQWVKGMDPGHAGLVLMVSPVMMALFSPLAGRLADRIDPGKIASAGMGIVAAGLLLLCALDQYSSSGFIMCSQLMLGMGFGLFSSPNTSAMMSSVKKTQLGMASSMNGTVRLFGQMLSMGFLMIVLSLTVGNLKAGPEAVPALLRAERIIFMLFCVLCLIGIIPSLVRGRVGWGNDTADEPSALD